MDMVKLQYLSSCPLGAIEVMPLLSGLLLQLAPLAPALIVEEGLLVSSVLFLYLLFVS
jgi:hypothetical protein